MPPTSGAGPGNAEGRPLTDRPTAYALDLDTTTVPHQSPEAREASRRRQRLHYLLGERPRISNELDELLADSFPTMVGKSVACDAFDPEPGITGDYWHDTLMDRGIPDRERHGLELAAAGFVPRWSA